MPVTTQASQENTPMRVFGELYPRTSCLLSHKPTHTQEYKLVFIPKEIDRCTFAARDCFTILHLATGHLQTWPTDLKSIEIRVTNHVRVESVQFDTTGRTDLVSYVSALPYSRSEDTDKNIRKNLDERRRQYLEEKHACRPSLI